MTARAEHGKYKGLTPRSEFYEEFDQYRNLNLSCYRDRTTGLYRVEVWSAGGTTIYTTPDMSVPHKAHRIARNWIDGVRSHIDGAPPENRGNQ